MWSDQAGTGRRDNTVLGVFGSIVDEEHKGVGIVWPNIHQSVKKYHGQQEETFSVETGVLWYFRKTMFWFGKDKF